MRKIRTLFYSQVELEKRGWQLTPSEQRKLEISAVNIISATLSVSFCLSMLSVILLYQTEEAFNKPLYNIVYNIGAVSFFVLFFGIIAALAKKN